VLLLIALSSLDLVLLVLFMLNVDGVVIINYVKTEMLLDLLQEDVLPLGNMATVIALLPVLMVEELVNVENVFVRSDEQVMHVNFL